MAIGVLGCFLLDPLTGLVGGCYLVLGLLYTSWLKKVVLLDVLAIAAAFVLRAIAGATAINVQISPWLIICTVQLSLFLALAKRRCEIVSLGDEAANHRTVLEAYSAGLLDQLIAVVTSSTVIAYSLYTINERTINVLGTRYMPLTIPFVVYGIFRYLYLIHKESTHGQPDVLLLTDRPLLICVALWGLACLALIVLAHHAGAALR
jgi:4-hydroxybenzoate polyprenyltransferase